MRRLFLTFLLFMACLLPGRAQQPRPSPTPPPDRPTEVTADEIKQFEETLKPYIEKARQTYQMQRSVTSPACPRANRFP